MLSVRVDDSSKNRQYVDTSWQLDSRRTCVFKAEKN